jgi:hypothetical protein
VNFTHPGVRNREVGGGVLPFGRRPGIRGRRASPPTSIHPPIIFVRAAEAVLSGRQPPVGQKSPGAGDPKGEVGEGVFGFAGPVDPEEAARTSPAPTSIRPPITLPRAAEGVLSGRQPPGNWSKGRRSPSGSRRRLSQSTRRCRLPGRLPRHSKRHTSRGSSTAISNPRISSCAPMLR